MARKPDIIYVNYYTDGSAARKVAPSVPVREDVRVAKRRPQKRKAISAGAESASVPTYELDEDDGDLPF